MFWLQRVSLQMVLLFGPSWEKSGFDACITLLRDCSVMPGQKHMTWSVFAIEALLAKLRLSISAQELSNSHDELKYNADLIDLHDCSWHSLQGLWGFPTSRILDFLHGNGEDSDSKYPCHQNEQLDRVQVFTQPHASMDVNLWQWHVWSASSRFYGSTWYPSWRPGCNQGIWYVAHSMIGKPYSCVAHDIWIEPTMNKGSKLKSGWLAIPNNEKQLLSDTRNSKHQNFSIRELQ